MHTWCTTAMLLPATTLMPRRRPSIALTCAAPSIALMHAVKADAHLAHHGHADAGDHVHARAQALDRLQDGRLARSVGSEQPENLALADLEADPSHGLHLAVGAVQAFNCDDAPHFPRRKG